MDTDSLLCSPIDTDLFEEMKKNNYVYGYRADAYDPAYVVRRLYDYTEEFVRENQIQLPKHFKFPPPDQRELVPIYYNNFEVIDIKQYMANPILMNFTEQVYQSGEIYRKRWGDAPLRFLGLNIVSDLCEHGGDG
jgi:mannosyltransferase